MSQSSGPSLMRHCEEQMSEPDIPLRGSEPTITTSTAISKIMISSILEADVYGDMRFRR